MIITEPNKTAAKIHDRMPVLLTPNQFEPWLSGKAGTEILKPAVDGMIVMRPVSKRVNTSRADDSDPTLIDAVAHDIAHYPRQHARQRRAACGDGPRAAAVFIDEFGVATET
jgi:hypothetical protein